MILMKLLYLILVIVLGCFWILYIDSIALVMLLCTLIFAIVLKILMLSLKHCSHAALSCNVDTCTSGESIPVTITIENKLPFSFSQMYAIIDLQHSFGAEKERLRLQFPLQAKNITKMTFYIHADFCGSLNISLEKLYVLDYLHLFRTNINVHLNKAAVLILPKRFPMNISDTSDPVYCSESDVFGNRPGDDPSEIFGIHEYIPGDPVSRIHWKLSSKSDQTLVKEFSTPVHKSVLLVTDFHWTRTSSQFIMREAESFLSVLYSLTCTMIEQRSVPTIVWYHIKSEKIQHFTPTTSAEITEMFCELYLTLDSMIMDVQNLLNESVGTQFSSVTCISNDLTETLLNAIDIQIDANQRNIILINEEQKQNDIFSENCTLILTTPDNITKDIDALII